MAIAEGSILQQILGCVDLVEFTRDIRTFDTRYQQLLATIMHFAVDIPQANMFIAGLFGKECAFQYHVVACNHRKAVKSLRSILRLVTRLWAPSVLSPDWNQVQVSSSSPCGQAFAISRIMVAVEFKATSTKPTLGNSDLSRFSKSIFT